MKIAGIDFPDKCPKDCFYSNGLQQFGQNSACIRCPVLNCCGSEPLIRPDGYREDWAIEWKKFFDSKYEYIPMLYFENKTLKKVD